MTGQGDFSYLNCPMAAKEVNLGAEKTAFPKQTNKQNKQPKMKKKTKNLNIELLHRNKRGRRNAFLYLILVYISLNNSYYASFQLPLSVQ